MNLNLNWRVHGTIAAAIAGVIVAQYLGFFLLGEGFAFGLGSSLGAPIGGGVFQPKIIVGSGWFHLRAGQAVHVRYDAQVGAGCLRFYIRQFPYAIGRSSNQADIAQSGAGEVDLVAPTDGWFHMRIYGANPFFCANNVGSRNPLALRRNSVSYSMSWKVQPS